MNEISKEKTDEEKLLEKRKINNERQKRFKKRRKLKNAVADFISRLQRYKGIRLSKNELISINASLGLILRLPYR